MADSTRRVLCKTCGKEVDISDAKAYHMGRMTVYECFKCQRKGSNEADNFCMERKLKIRKEKGK